MNDRGTGWSFCGQKNIEKKEKFKDKVIKISKSIAGNGRQIGLPLGKDLS